MSEFGWVKAVADLGIAGVMAVGMVLLYRLVDKFATAFLEQQKEQTTAAANQATAMAALASAVREGQSDQKEVLFAVRLLADRMDQQRECLVAIEREMKGAA